MPRTLSRIAVRRTGAHPYRTGQPPVMVVDHSADAGSSHSSPFTQIPPVCQTEFSAVSGYLAQQVRPWYLPITAYCEMRQNGQKQDFSENRARFYPAHYVYTVKEWVRSLSHWSASRLEWGHSPAAGKVSHVQLGTREVDLRRPAACYPCKAMLVLENGPGIGQETMRPYSAAWSHRLPVGF